MPNKTIALTDTEAAELDAVAAASGTTSDALLLVEARAQIAQAKAARLAAWWRDLPGADKDRIYAAENV